MKTTFPLNSFRNLQTPFYYYDLERLGIILEKVSGISASYGYPVHYALKANANDRILKLIEAQGFGADCVSGYEIQKALSCGFAPDRIYFAGVGKADWEIRLGLESRIGCFNCESIQELQVTNEIAKSLNITAPISIRINPNVDARTHRYITTGIEENKFGINAWEWDTVVEVIRASGYLKFKGLHFHIGSQITSMDVFKGLCNRVNEISEWFINQKLFPEILDMGGGLGIDYSNGNSADPDFKTYFSIFHNHLRLQPGQRVHFEPGRALVAQCGSLISRVLFVKKGIKTNFAILDAGMTELIRPALYQAVHPIENLTSAGNPELYDVVGPICESSDCFGKAVTLAETHRGDLIAIRHAGAYGETMSSSYNLREKVQTYYSDEIPDND
jgi:diaminopimelate decarboxylase